MSESAERIPAGAAAAPMTAEARLHQELDILTGGGIIEVAVRNLNVRHYMDHWEGRATAAEEALRSERSARLAAEETGYRRGLEEERAAVVAALKRWGYPTAASTIENGDHLPRASSASQGER